MVDPMVHKTIPTYANLPAEPDCAEPTMRKQASTMAGVVFYVGG